MVVTFSNPLFLWFGAETGELEKNQTFMSTHFKEFYQRLDANDVYESSTFRFHRHRSAEVDRQYPLQQEDGKA